MRLIVIIILLAVSLSYAVLAQQPECDYGVDVIVNSSEFQKDDFRWRMRAVKIEGSPTNITGTARIEDLEGNTVKSYKPWSNDSISKQKTSSEYSPNLKEGSYKIISEISVQCQDKDKGNNVDAKIIKITNKKINPDIKNNNSEINFVPEVSKINNENKTDAIENTSQSQETKVINTSPEQNKNISDEQNNSLNEENNNIIYLNQENIHNNEMKPTASVVQKNEVIYESSNEKSKNMVIWLVLAISILINIVLIWKR